MTTEDNQRWSQVSPDLAKRPLVGVEKVLNYTEYYQNGNFQLTIALLFETSVASETLCERFPLALWSVRSKLPELGTSTVSNDQSAELDLDHALWQPIRSLEQAQQWLDDTGVIVNDGTSVQQMVDRLSNRRIEPIGKQFRVYLVCDPLYGAPGLIVNASHVLNGHRALFQGESIFKALLSPRISDATRQNPDAKAALAAIFKPEELNEALPKLPQSLNTAYADKFQPGAPEIEAGFHKVGEKLSNGAQPSIGIPRFQIPSAKPAFSLGSLDGTPMSMLNLRSRINAADNQSLKRACKKYGASVPSLVYACIVNSIDRHCGSSSSEAVLGANLAYSAHASRWMPAETFEERSPVNMAIVLGSGYLSPEELQPGQRGRNLGEAGLFALARTIRKKQDDFLDTPHIIGAMSDLGEQVSSQLAEVAERQREAGTDARVALSENSPLVCPPTLTSQGVITVKRFYTAQGASDELHLEQPADEHLEFFDICTGGRTTDASVCFAMFTHVGALTLQAHFDSHFFDAQLVRNILDDVVSQLGSAAASASLTSQDQAKL
ncbi:hypothetical protein PANT_19d00002 [Moesziomyces antarcticus T-34]|uniref:Acyl-CoA-dependent acyltransferase MAC2 n=1 Tax=Pseudozyma antarctica (strain T-34) TaxID=1151754 RepID=MAC2_PSEA3|nr:RecName: Full=Acyl-CoA-dependent acyltransferase MAC2; AltName: Full=Mannosylerythritol lipids (MELs) biosynthesis cluster protein MAC2 [Moesziomyces antarcticus T-34]GAC75888.1 hypothetical protein PANT_19d00002 [Moesziomyces antarcticus T-34]